MSAHVRFWTLGSKLYRCRSYTNANIRILIPRHLITNKTPFLLNLSQKLFYLLLSDFGAPDCSLSSSFECNGVQAIDTR